MTGLLDTLLFRLKLWLGLIKVEALEIEYCDDGDYASAMDQAAQLRRQLGVPVKVTKGEV